jgi:hypothetical protein
MSEARSKPDQSSTALRTVLKYAIDCDSMSAQHAIPEGSLLLDLQVQNGVPVMWWSVPCPAGEPSSWPLRSFIVAPTGGPGYTSNLHYVGTFQLGAFVGHVMSHEAFDRG